MKNIISNTIGSNDHCLAYIILNSSSQPTDLSLVEKMIRSAWKDLSPYIKNRAQLLVVRDIQTSDYDFPFGNCYTPLEANVYVPSWSDHTGIEASIRHELHHMARWNGPGFGSSLGEAIVSEGFATLYEDYSAHWSPPIIHQKVPEKILKRALADWHSKEYDHQAWFFGSEELPPFIGYSIGRHIIRTIMPDFSLNTSLTMTAENIYQKYQQYSAN